MQTLIKRLQGPRGPFRTWSGKRNKEVVANSLFSLLDRDGKKIWQWAARDADGKVLQILEVQIPEGYPDQLWYLREIVADYFHPVRSLSE